MAFFALLCVVLVPAFLVWCVRVLRSGGSWWSLIPYFWVFWTLETVSVVFATHGLALMALFPALFLLFFSVVPLSCLTAVVVLRLRSQRTSADAWALRFGYFYVLLGVALLIWAAIHHRKPMRLTLQCSEHRSVSRLLLTHQPRHSALSLTLSSLIWSCSSRCLRADLTEPLLDRFID